jgi:hypothetical protein
MFRNAVQLLICQAILPVLLAASAAVIETFWNGAPFRPEEVQIDVETIPKDGKSKSVEHWIATREGMQR